MIVDPYLRAIVEKSGRREITSSMVAQAEKERNEAKKASEIEYWKLLIPISEERRQQMALQQGYFLQGIASQQYHSQGGLAELASASIGGALSGIIGYIGRCPYCGK